MKTFERILLFSVIMVGACTPPPMGNTVGLNGDYTGDRSMTSTGTYTSYGFGTSQTTINDKTDDTPTISITKAYSVDAQMLGFPCELPLKADGQDLKLSDVTTCTNNTHSEARAMGSTASPSTTDDNETIKFTDARVKAGSKTGSVHITATASIKRTKQQDGSRTADTDITVTYDFDGTRVAGE